MIEPIGMLPGRAPHDAWAGLGLRPLHASWATGQAGYLRVLPAHATPLPPPAPLFCPRGAGHQTGASAIRGATPHAQNVTGHTAHQRRNERRGREGARYIILPVTPIVFRHDSVTRHRWVFAARPTQRSSRCTKFPPRRISLHSLPATAAMPTTAVLGRCPLAGSPRTSRWREGAHKAGTGVGRGWAKRKVARSMCSEFRRSECVAGIDRFFTALPHGLGACAGADALCPSALSQRVLLGAVDLPPPPALCSGSKACRPAPFGDTEASQRAPGDRPLFPLCFSRRSPRPSRSLCVSAVCACGLWAPHLLPPSSLSLPCARPGAAISSSLRAVAEEDLRLVNRHGPTREQRFIATPELPPAQSPTADGPGPIAPAQERNARPERRCVDVRARARARAGRSRRLCLRRIRSAALRLRPCTRTRDLGGPAPAAAPSLRSGRRGARRAHRERAFVRSRCRCRPPPCRLPPPPRPSPAAAGRRAVRSRLLRVDARLPRHVHRPPAGPAPPPARVGRGRGPPRVAAADGPPRRNLTRGDTSADADAGAGADAPALPADADALDAAVQTFSGAQHRPAAAAAATAGRPVAAARRGSARTTAHAPQEVPRRSPATRRRRRTLARGRAEPRAGARQIQHRRRRFAR